MTLAQSLQQKTKKALLWMSLSNELFLVVYGLIPFILRKDFAASILQLSILSALRPVLPLFSFYWSARLTNRPHLLRSNLMGAWILARIGFVFVSWIPHTWYIILCCVLYELFNKSGLPALIEILNLNLPKETREKTFTSYYVLSFIESIFLSFFVGGLLTQPDHFPCLCSIAAAIALTSLWIQLQLPIPRNLKTAPPIKLSFIQPWKEAFSLLKNRPDFSHFQYGFMIGGFGLMLMIPCFALFAVDTLSLSHIQFTTGRSMLMGVGITLSAYFWRKKMALSNISKLTQSILLGFGLFPITLLLAPYHMTWFYLAYFLYGIAQAGSHLLWNLSGTLFAGETEDSSPFSRVNILMIGLRGLVAPALGGLLCYSFGPKIVLALGALVCFSGIFYMRRSESPLTSKTWMRSPP